MGRPKRAADGGLVYHVTNRANAWMTIFEDDEDYAAFEQVLEQAVAHRHSTGSGHVYQGRFKSFPVPEDEHFYTVCRYVERNALRANLAPGAQRWRWGCLHRWKQGTAKEKSLLAAWPLPRLAGWVEHVNGPQTEAELATLRRCVQRGRPFGAGAWCDQIVRRLGLPTSSAASPSGRW